MEACCGMRTVALGLCLSGGTSASRIRRGFFDADGTALADVEVVHPGHAAVQTTRLLRHDHGGLAALVEAERHWELDSSLLQEGDDEETTHSLGWTMSRQQLAGLRQHQRTALAEADGQSSLVEASGDEDAPTALRLSSLSSEYVGPIGVGSVVSSPACAAMAQRDKAINGSSMLQGCKVGAQSQVFVVFDTGSTNIWINSDMCTSGSCAKKDRHRYDHTKSQSYERPNPDVELSVKFGTGAMKGPLALDNFKVGPVTVRAQSFAMIEEQTGDVFESLPLEGIVGLAFPAMAPEGTTAFMENVIQQQALPHNEVSFYFSAQNPSANAILWGGVDSKFYEGPIEYFNVARPWYWSLDLKAFKIGTENVLETVVGDPSFAEEEPETPWEAVIDSGTTYLTAPTPLFKQIMMRVPEVRCRDMTAESHPPITFVFESAAGEDREFSLENTQYMVREGAVSASVLCTPAIAELSLNGEHARSMLVGQVFMKWYFTVFDRVDGKPQNARVGFAQATQGRGVNSHLRSITSEQIAFSDRHEKAFNTQA